MIVYGALTMVGAIAVSQQRGSIMATDLVPVAVGFVTWLVTLSLLTEPLRNAELSSSMVDAPAEVGAEVEAERLEPARAVRPHRPGFDSVLA